MTYKHLTTRELTLIANFWHQGTKAYQAAKLLKRSQETIYRVYRFLDSGKTIAQYLKGRIVKPSATVSQKILHMGFHNLTLFEDDGSADVGRN